LAQKFAPVEDENGNTHWKNEGDELRFFRFMTFCGKCAAARAQFESPRYAAIAVANQEGGLACAGSLCSTSLLPAGGRSSSLKTRAGIDRRAHGGAKLPTAGFCCPGGPGPQNRAGVVWRTHL